MWAFWRDMKLARWHHVSRRIIASAARQRAQHRGASWRSTRQRQRCASHRQKKKKNSGKASIGNNGESVMAYENNRRKITGGMASAARKALISAAWQWRKKGSEKAWRK
jgi:hypothetical protein